MALMKKALITGIFGQDGYYLTKYLTNHGYDVVGVTNEQGGDSGYDLFKNLKVLKLDITNSQNVDSLFKEVQFDEIYHLAAISEPWVSFKDPNYVIDVNIGGTVNILEALKNYSPKSKLFYASSCVINQLDSPYALTKSFCHELVKIYRQKYNLFLVNGILFNHESPRRGINFVTQKVALAAALAKLGLRNSKELNELGKPIFENNKLKLGNLDIERDWGYAGDFVEAMYKSLQVDTPDDYEIATGTKHSLRDLLKTAFGCVGKNYKDYLEVDNNLVRKNEQKVKDADISKTKKILKWTPKTTFKELVKMMVDSNITRLKQNN